MRHLHFLRPEYFYLLIPLFFLILILFLKIRKSSGWDKICSKDLLPYVVVNKTKNNFLFAFLLFALFSWLIAAVAGPSWKEVDEPVFKPRDGVVIALDLSDAMNVDDIKPSRLKRAIYKINDILEKRKAGQTALVVFSANSFAVTPLTDDVATIQAQLAALDTTIMPQKGHDASKAIQKASDLLKQAGVMKGSILLITSQLSDVDLNKSIEITEKGDFKLAILGVGSENTTPILKPDGGFMKDAKGGILTTKLPVDRLKKLAEVTKGLYLDMKIDESDVELLTHTFENQSHIDQDQSKTGSKKWQDQGYLLVLLALPFISLLFRRGVLLTLFFLMPRLCFAGFLESNDVKAESLYHNKDYSAAKELFEDPSWKGCAHYQLEEYEEASELFKENNSVDGLYNYGTARAKCGDFEEAISAYDKLLELKPDHEDALFNKKLIEEHQKKQEQQKPEQSDDKNKNEQDKSKQDENEQNKNEQTKDEQDEKGDKDEKGQDKQDNNGDQEDSEDDNQSDNENKKDDIDESEDDSLPQDDKESETKEDLQRKKDDRLLDRIKDDPGGLLRRKFLQQYRRQS